MSVLFGADPLPTFDWDALMAMEFPPERYLIDPLIPLRGPVAISGKGKAFKTWFMLSQCLCVAAERCFLNKFPTMQGTVLVLALEGGLREHHRRVQALARGLDITGSIPLHTFEGRFTAQDPQQKDALKSLIAKLEPKLVAVDHMRACFAGVEDDSERARDIQNFVKEMEEVYPSAWTFLAHEGHRGTNIRGSSGQEHILDSQLSVERKIGATAKVTQLRLRSGLELPPFEVGFIGPEEPGGAGFEYLGEQEEDDAPTSEAEFDARVFSEVRRAGGRILRPHLIRALGIPSGDDGKGEQHRMDRSVARLEKRGRLGREPQGKYIAFYVLNGAT